MPDLDNESVKFLKWVKEELKSDYELEDLTIKVTSKAEDYLFTHMDSLRSKLEQKLIKGGLEHGAPNKYTQEEITKELEAEYLDLLGWTLVGKWCMLKAQKDIQNVSEPNKA